MLCVLNFCKTSNCIGHNAILYEPFSEGSIEETLPAGITNSVTALSVVFI